MPIVANLANQDRAARAEAVLLQYKHQHLKESGLICDETVIDFLSDLCHLMGSFKRVNGMLNVSGTHFLADRSKGKR